MERIKSSWKRLPNKPRRILTLLIGLLLILTSGLIGWIPGPGGMVPFLLGIALLATEFTWAERLRDTILGMLKRVSHAAKQRPRVALLLAVFAAITVGLFAYVFYTHIL